VASHQLFFDFEPDGKPRQPPNAVLNQALVPRKSVAPHVPLGVAVPHPGAIPSFRTGAQAAPAPREAPIGLTEAQVAKWFIDFAQKVQANGIKRVAVEFKSFRSTYFSYRLKHGGLAQLRFHEIFRHAPPRAVKQTFGLMLAGCVKTKPPRDAFDAFVASLPPAAFNQRGKRQVRARAKPGPGEHRSLEDSFARVNRRYFHGTMPRPELCWSPGRSRRILGSYTQETDRLIVSRIFDSPKVPLFVLDYLMYHELLHKKLGIGRRADGKRCFHGPEFKRLERLYERFDEAVNFLKTLR
jgi:hypothetical protein